MDVRRLVYSVHIHSTSTTNLEQLATKAFSHGENGVFRALLQSCLEKEITHIGQITFTRDFRLMHIEDYGRDNLHIYTEPDAAREIARFDDMGRYRPLKSAPNLRHGWELRLASIDEVHIALDCLYPAALGLWRASLGACLTGTPIRRTLERQSGMYRVASRITDKGIAGLIRDFCGKKCIRRRVWGTYSSKVELEEKNNLNEIPLLCSEACNLLIAEARRVVKKGSKI